MFRRIAAGFFCILLLGTTVACQSKWEFFDSKRRFELMGEFVASLHYPDGELARECLYDSDLSNPETRAVVEGIRGSAIHLTARETLAGEGNGGVRVSDQLYYFLLRLSYVLEGEDETEHSMELGFYAIASDRDIFDDYERSGHIAIRWESIPESVRKGLNKPAEDNGVTVLDLLNATQAKEPKGDEIVQ